MNAEDKELDWSSWFSTYGVLTAQRILERYNLKLKQDELLAVIKDKNSVCYQLLQVPLKNVFNGIILQQAQDYQIYAQKLLTEFLLSGENDVETNAPGVEIRLSLREATNEITQLNKDFSKQEEEHHKLIAKSQDSFIQLSRKWRSNNLSEISEYRTEVEENVSLYLASAETMGMQLQAYRRIFQELAMQISGWMRQLPHFHLDVPQDEQNKEDLNFDSQIGESQ